MYAYKTCSRVAVARFYSPFDCVDVRTTHVCGRIFVTFSFISVVLNSRVRSEETVRQIFLSDTSMVKR